MLQILRNLKQRITVGRYIKACLDYGDALSYLAVAGKCVNFETLEARHSSLEKKIISYGYEPYTRREIILAGGYGKGLPPLRRKGS